MSGTRWNKRPVTSDFVLEPILGAGMEGPRLRWARIENVDRMRPFFTTLASSSDHWGFISSVGPLTAGRRNVSQALFPYRTVDRIHDARGKVGGSTTVRLEDGSVWDPFTERNEGLRDVSRTIHRCSLGSALALEETDHDLGLRIRQTWTTSERHGLVRAVTLTNLGNAPKDLAVLDGVLDLVPASIDPGMARTLSNLVDAYRQTGAR